MDNKDLLKLTHWNHMLREIERVERLIAVARQQFPDDQAVQLELDRRTTNVQKHRRLAEARRNQILSVN